MKSVVPKIDFLIKFIWRLQKWEEWIKYSSHVMSSDSVRILMWRHRQTMSVYPDVHLLLQLGYWPIIDKENNNKNIFVLIRESSTPGIIPNNLFLKFVMFWHHFGYFLFVLFCTQLVNETVWFLNVFCIGFL